MSTQNQKTIFITGSSSGLGRATAKLFSSKGWNVIATMRNPDKETELHKLAGVVLLPLDVTDPKQIKETVDKAVTMGGVDVVFNNAGYGMAGPLEGLTDEQIVRMVDTNMMGAIRTTKAFVPYFREKGAGLFINTTSIGGLITVPFNSLYHATKWALEGWSESLAFELRQFGIGLKTVEPGGMKTDFFTRSFDTGRHQAYDKLVDKVMSVITDPKQMETYSSPAQIAEVVYEAATDGKDQLRYVAGEDAKATYAMRLQVGDEAFRKAMEQQFFGPEQHKSVAVQIDRGFIMSSAEIVRLKNSVTERDHASGAATAPVTLLEYGNFECIYCGQAFPVIKQVRKLLGDDLRFVFRHFPTVRTHPHSLRAATAAEAAAAQGKFWEMHDELCTHQQHLEDQDLFRYAKRIGLDVERFTLDMTENTVASKVEADYNRSLFDEHISGTPTFYINGLRWTGVMDVAPLLAAIKAADTEGRIPMPPSPSGIRALFAQIRRRKG